VKNKKEIKPLKEEPEVKPPSHINGRFAPGNKCSVGNGAYRQAAALRRALISAVSPEDMVEVITTIVQLAKGGSIPAAKILFDRTLGPPEAIDVMKRLEELEAKLGEFIDAKNQT
jgi:hypothetical protein